jgi:hypothetical protein
MNYGTRFFILIGGKIQQIGIERISRMCNEVVPEYAGQKIPYALLLFKEVNGKLGDLRQWGGRHLIFDKEGNADENSGWNLIRLSQAGKENPKSFAARRAEQIRRENTWNPTAEQLNEMIGLSKSEGSS